MVDQAELKQNRAWVGVICNKLLDAFHLYIAMCISDQLVNNIVIGGALYLLGQVLVVYTRLYSKKNSARLPRRIQVRALVVFLATALLLATLVFVYPALTRHPLSQLLLACIVLLLLRQGLSTLLSRSLPLKRVWRVLILVLSHALFTGAVTGTLAGHLGEEPFRDIATMLIATALATMAFQLVEIPNQPVSIRPNADHLHKVSAYRIYNSMTSTIVVALNLALLAYICYIQFEPVQSMLVRFWNLVIWLLLVSGVTFLVLQFFRRRAIPQYDKPSILIAGALLLILAIIGTYQNWFTGLFLIVGYCMWGVGLACMLSIIISMGADMQAVLELDMKPEDLRGYRETTMAVVEWNLTLSTLLLLIMMTVIAFISEGTIEKLDNATVLGMVVENIMIWPPIFVCIALAYALIQPLNRDYAKKLAHFRAQQRIGKANPALQTRLKMILWQRTRRLAPSVMRAIIRPLMPCRVIGKEHVNLENGPVVFVCNHLEIYGPLVTNMYLPFYFRSWIIARMLDREAVADQLENGVQIIFHWAPEGIRKRLPRWVAPLVLLVLKSLDPIPVYRGNMREVLQTLRLTVDAMEYEDNILIFPENPEDGIYKSSGVSPFFSGFASIGSEYYKRTGNCTTFYPMYASRAQKTLTIGEGVTYNANNARAEEKERIVHTLYDWMRRQAGETPEEDPRSPD